MKRFNFLMAVFLVLVMIFGLSLSVLAVLAPGDDPGDEPGDPEEPEPPTKIKGNNGIGNGVDPQPPGDPKENDTDESNTAPGQLKKTK